MYYMLIIQGRTKNLMERKKIKFRDSMFEKIKNIILTFTKLFMVMGIGCILFGVMFSIALDIIRVPHKLNNIDFYLKSINTYSLLGFTIIWCMINTFRYIKKTQTISQDINEEAEALFLEIKNRLKKMKWKVERENTFVIIFKSPIIKTIWKETFKLEIIESSVRVIGSKLYVEKVLKESGYEFEL